MFHFKSGDISSLKSISRLKGQPKAIFIAICTYDQKGDPVFYWTGPFTSSMFCAQLNLPVLGEFFLLPNYMLSIGFKLNCVDELTSFELVKVESFVSGGKSMI